MALLALLAASGLSGCGGGPKLVSVTGTVLLNGKPFKDADIVFIPDSSNKDGRPGADKTGPEGNYTAMSAGRIGLVPGKYKVLISKALVDVSRVPKEHQDDPYMARIVINERTGTIVATSTVRISQVAIAHGSLTITVTSNVGVSQPNGFSSGGQTTTVPSTQTSVNEGGKGGFTILDEPPTIERLAAALNALGVSTRDMMAIFQTLKRSGALQAELIIN